MFRFVDNALFKARLMAHKFLHHENGEVNIVATVVLIGIAVILAVLFKDQVAKLINGLFSQLGDNANKAINNQT